MTDRIPAAVRADVETLWDFHDMRHPGWRTDVGIGLGSHDLGVATHTADLYAAGSFPLIVFTGKNAPTTIDRFPRGEAVHFREHALSLGVPVEAVLVETEAKTTAENIVNTRDLITASGVTPTSVTLVSRPYQQRRAYGSCRHFWPEVTPVCSVQRIPLDAYVAQLADADRVINMLVGDTQRLVLDGRTGQGIVQELPDEVRGAYHRLNAAGYDARVLPIAI